MSMETVLNEDGTETILLAPWDLDGLCRDLKSNPEEYQLLTEIRLMSPDPKPVTLSDIGMSNLMNILNLTQCKRIQFISIAVNFHFSCFDRMHFRHLEQITVNNCREHLELISKLASACPNLHSLVEFNSESNGVVNNPKLAQRLSNCLGQITHALEANPRLTTFESPSLLGELKLMLADRSVKTQYRTCLRQFERLLPEALTRNQEAYQNYHGAMYQILLIKKFRPRSLFRFVNHDVVRMIVGLIKASIWHPVWRP
jgi:cytoplasmic iron level regulating protein YaaA (DUF328/UPF0246 family)